MPAVLEARGVVKEFPGVRALDGVNFDLQAGEIHALLGENGAGKSTLTNILTGVYRQDAGEVFVMGEEVEFDSPRAAAQRGIGVIHQDYRFAPHLSVAMNVSLDDIPVRRDRLGSLFQLVDRDAVLKRATVAMAAVGNPVPTTMLAGRLSAAQTQLVQIGRALSGRLTTLLLDEPTSSLSPSERDKLFSHLHRLKERGIGILYISHRLEEIVEIADRATILRDGRVVGSVDRVDLSVDRVSALMLGTSTVLRSARVRRALGEPILELRGLTREPVFRDVDLTVREGEIVGLTGLVGAGRTEVARCVFGVEPSDRGEIHFRGTRVVARSPREAIALGIGFASEDRKAQGILGMRSIHDNLILSSLARADASGRFLRFGQWIRRRVSMDLGSKIVGTMHIRPQRLSALVGTMSGGNQQKVILGRWLITNTPLLILDEPTRGVDVGAKGEIWSLLHQLATDGIAILAISSEVPELLAHADRIVVMKGGRVSGHLPHETATEAEVLLLAGGRN